MSVLATPIFHSNSEEDAPALSISTKLTSITVNIIIWILIFYFNYDNTILYSSVRTRIYRLFKRKNMKNIYYKSNTNIHEIKLNAFKRSRPLLNENQNSFFTYSIKCLLGIC